MVAFITENRDSNVTNAIDKKIENPEKIVINQEKRELIDRLLLEKISLAGISRAVKVSEKWLQMYVNQK